MADPVTIVVADDHAPIRAGVRDALEADGFTVLGEAANASAALELVQTHLPQVCLLDIHMPGGGISAAAQIASTFPETAIVMLTFSDADDDLFASLRAGARGYLLKSIDPDGLGPALRGVIRGDAALSPELAARVLAEFRATRRRGGLSRRPSGPVLTSRETEIMDLLRQGMGTGEIAKHLSVSASTVRVHVSNVLKKLHATDRAAALRMLGNG